MAVVVAVVAVSVLLLLLSGFSFVWCANFGVLPGVYVRSAPPNKGQGFLQHGHDFESH